jgi:hypothetical protein
MLTISERKRLHEMNGTVAKVRRSYQRFPRSDDSGTPPQLTAAVTYSKGEHRLPIRLYLYARQVLDGLRGRFA